MSQVAAASVGAVRTASDPVRARVVSGTRLADLPQVRRLGEDVVHDIRVVAAVLPFKVNGYVLDELIDWDRAPDDPVYRMTFPNRDMLPPDAFAAVSGLVARGVSGHELRRSVVRWAQALNPDSSAQLRHNVPLLDGAPLVGVQHKYRETLLVFPAHGQTCHSYCAYCFRWPQFVALPGMHQAVSDPRLVARYLQGHPEVTDVLFTGGDPMTMSAQLLHQFVDPLLDSRFEHLRNVRIGTKALAYWPFRFTTDTDADETLRLFDRVVTSGRSLAVMAHFSHPRELATDAVGDAIRRIRATGAVIRSQAPAVRYVNDDPEVWARMWAEQVRLGITPYYMFIDRNTGAHRYFSLPLHQVTQLYRDAIAQVSGLARTARGPVMSATPGKVVIDGTATIAGTRVFVLRFLQARDATRVGRPFFAQWSADATWHSDLRPALGSPVDWFEPAVP